MRFYSAPDCVDKLFHANGQAHHAKFEKHVEKPEESARNAQSEGGCKSTKHQIPPLIEV